MPGLPGIGGKKRTKGPGNRFAVASLLLLPIGVSLPVDSPSATSLLGSQRVLACASALRPGEHALEALTDAAADARSSSPPPPPGQEEEERPPCGDSACAAQGGPTGQAWRTWARHLLPDSQAAVGLQGTCRGGRAIGCASSAAGAAVTTLQTTTTTRWTGPLGTPRKVGPAATTSMGKGTRRCPWTRSRETSRRRRRGRKGAPRALSWSWRVANG